MKQLKPQNRGEAFAVILALIIMAQLAIMACGRAVDKQYEHNREVDARMNAKMNFRVPVTVK